MYEASIQTKEGTTKTVTFMFNPNTVKISKSNKWEYKHIAGKDLGKWIFEGGNNRTVTFELYFDSTLSASQLSRGTGTSGAGGRPTSVRQAIDDLYSLMAVSSEKTDTNTTLGRPVKCALNMGQDTGYAFDCIVQSFEVTLMLFDENGVPKRARGNITLQEAQDISNPQTGTNPTSVGEPGYKYWMVNEGDRLDLIAYHEYGNANEWRRIAEANHIENPLALKPGTLLAIPPR